MTVPKAVVVGVFQASDPVRGGVVTGGGTCGIPADRQWEPRLHRSVLAGEVRVATRGNALTVAAPSLVVEGRRR